MKHLDGCHILNNGIKIWYKNDLLHREDGPAAEYPNGVKMWYFNGQLHREDGPACIFPATAHASASEGYYLLDYLFRTRQEYERMLRLKAFW